MKSLFINFLRGGDEDFIASSQPVARTSSSLPAFLLGICKYKPEDEYGAATGEYGVKLDGKPNLDLLKGTGSVRTGELWFDFISMDSRSPTKLCESIV